MVRKLSISKIWRLPKTILLVAILLVAAIVYTFLANRPNHGSGVIPTTAPTKAPVATPIKEQAAEPSNSEKNSSSSGNSTTSPTAGAILEAPSGTFVSNHHPNLSGSPAPSQEQSVCNTTPGATCYIKFTNGSIVKTLAVETIDANGAAYWSWDVNKAGFTAGDWQITAVASLNGQTKTASDSLTLQVQP
jgi:hypothetical protein